MLDVAAEADGELAVLARVEPDGRSTVRLIVKKRWPSGVSTIWRDDPARRLEGAVQIPARAGAAEAREGEGLAGEALGDVAGGDRPAA